MEDVFHPCYQHSNSIYLSKIADMLSMVSRQVFCGEKTRSTRSAVSRKRLQNSSIGQLSLCANLNKSSAFLNTCLQLLKRGPFSYCLCKLHVLHLVAYRSTDYRVI